MRMQTSNIADLMGPSQQTHTFSGKRMVYTTHIAFDDVVEKLRRQTNPQDKAESRPPWPSKPHGDMVSKEEFHGYWDPQVGRSGFTYFAEIDYGDWIRLFDVGQGRKMKRFIVGNPLIAITMIKHDLNASLFTPVELLLKQRVDNEGGGTEISYNLPSSLMMIGHSANNMELLEAAKILDSKLEALMQNLCVDM